MDSRYEYDNLPLAAFPGLVVPVAVEQEAGRILVWVPVRRVCEHLSLDVSSQQRKIKDPDGDYDGLWRSIDFPSGKGEHETLMLEFEGVVQWLANVQESRVGAKAKAYIHTYRREVWRAASAIMLSGHTAALAEGRPPQRVLPAAGSRKTEQGASRAVVDRIVEERLAYLEDGFVALTQGGTRAANCPYCGGPLTIMVGSLRIVRADT